jgi:hypothetical protein
MHPTTLAPDCPAPDGALSTHPVDPSFGVEVWEEVARVGIGSQLEGDIGRVRAFDPVEGQSGDVRPIDGVGVVRRDGWDVRLGGVEEVEEEEVQREEEIAEDPQAGGEEHRWKPAVGGRRREGGQDRQDSRLAGLAPTFWPFSL